MEWLFIFGVVILGTIIGIVYMTISLARFNIFKRIEKKWLRYVVSFTVIAAAFLIMRALFNMTNAIIIFLHVFGFFLIYQIIWRIITHFRKLELKAYIPGILAIVTSVIYLGIGYYLCSHVWVTTYDFTSDKIDEPIKIAMFADSHLGTTFDGDGFAVYMEEIMQYNPDIVLICGDFVDDDSKKEDMIKACAALGRMNPRLGIYYVYGNHDKGYFRNRDFTAEELKEELIKNGVHVMEDDIEYAGNLCIVGRMDASARNGNQSFKDGEMTKDFGRDLDLLMDEIDTSKYIIIMDHQPTDYDNESNTAVDLVLSGHTHGGQLFPFNNAGKLFGLSDSVYGHTHLNGTDFIVTSGISDWALLFKTGTKSEYVIINVK